MSLSSCIRLEEGLGSGEHRRDACSTGLEIEYSPQYCWDKPVISSPAPPASLNGQPSLTEQYWYSPLLPCPKCTRYRTSNGSSPRRLISATDSTRKLTGCQEGSCSLASCAVGRSEEG